jgi:hypothetical protein
MRMNDGIGLRARSVDVKRMGLSKRGLRSLSGLSLGLALMWGVAGCHSSPAQNSSSVDQNAGDPADANMAPANGSAPAQALGQNDQNPNQQQGEDYGPPPQQQAAPIERVSQSSGDPNYGNGQPADNGQYSDQQAADAYAADLTDAQASDPPPPLPDYDQPPAPDPNYLWTPGYWAWGPGGYYWVPGKLGCGAVYGRAVDAGLLGICGRDTIASTMGSGGCTSGSMAALTMALDTPAMDTMAGIGTATSSTTTPQSTA